MAKITVGWCPIIDPKLAGVELFMEKPESVFKTHMKDSGYKYKLCPATVEVARNTFIVNAPFDLHFKMRSELKQIELFGPTLPPEEFFYIRSDQHGETDTPLMSIYSHQLLLAEDNNVNIMVTSPWFEMNTNTQFKIIPGRMNISKWWRALDFAFQLNTMDQEVIIKAGEPLFYVNFYTDNPDDVVVIKEIQLTTELRTYVRMLTDSKFFQAKCPLNKLYSLAQRFKSMKKRPKLVYLE